MDWRTRRHCRRKRWIAAIAIVTFIAIAATLAVVDFETLPPGTPFLIAVISGLVASIAIALWVAQANRRHRARLAQEGRDIDRLEREKQLLEAREKGHI